jgi:serine/threonine protein phosphatase PrpC
LVNCLFNLSDGHGGLGHEISQYLIENLPVNLNNKLKGKNILTDNCNKLIEETFVQLNYKIHNSNKTDPNYSGSTCVSLIYTPEKIITANVGDSRAVLGRYKNNGKSFFNDLEWISHDLTRDHKPTEKDEALRIKKKGGRIMPFRDDDGEFVGPQRVWIKEDDVPGLAMSRSFGDKVASEVGVIAEPGNILLS